MMEILPMSDTRSLLFRVLRERDWLERTLARDLRNPSQYDQPGVVTTRTSRRRDRFWPNDGNGQTARLLSRAIAEAIAAGVPALPPLLQTLLAAHRDLADAMVELAEGAGDDNRPAALIRFGEAWAAVDPYLAAVEAKQPSVSTAGNVEPPPQAPGYVSSFDLAAKHERKSEALRKRLDRFRRDNKNGWQEVKDRLPTEPQFLYLESAVLDIIMACPVQLSGIRPA
jgi:hypothetical protein